MIWLALLGCRSDPLTAERTALQAFEHARLTEAIREAHASRDQVASGELCVHARAASHPEASQACDALLTSLAIYEDWASRMHVHNLLYEAATTPEARDHHRRATQDAVAMNRYRNAPEQAAAARAGVTRTRALAAVDELRREFVTPLPDARLLEAAAHRLELLGPVLTAGTPRFQPAQEGPFDDALGALLDQAVALGFPPEAAAAEAAEAVFQAADAYSRPVWPAQIAAWDERHAGSHPGRIGVSFDRVDGVVKITGLNPDGPAWAAGVHLDDRITSVDTVDLRPLAEAEAMQATVDHLPGPDGAPVTLGVERAGKPLSFTLDRATLQDRTVAGYRHHGKTLDPWITPEIAFLRLGAFRPHTAEEFAQAIAGLDPKRLILDLRGNGGGDLDSALAILDLFQRGGPMIQLEGRVKPVLAEDFGQASPGGPLEDLEKIVVLVDRKTASSAEILAGGLQLLGATVIGERTTGKGSTQVLRVLEAQGIALQFTNLHWRLGDGSSIQRTATSLDWGVQPDRVLPLTPLERYAVGVLQAKREAPGVHADGSALAYRGAELDPEAPAWTHDPQIQGALTVFE